MAYNIANLSGAAYHGKLKSFDRYFPKRSTERVEKPPLEKRILEGHKLHNMPIPKGYEYLAEK